jgi:hypothetical protein
MEKANQGLAKLRNALSETGKLSSQDLVLARMLDLSSQLTHTEMFPGAMRFWSETFRNERPEMIERAFKDYLAKRGKFFPKPADITETIERLRAGYAIQDSDRRPTREETEREQATPEWEEMNKKLRAQFAKLAGRTAFPGKRA